jgi:hypothetical protein
MINAVGRNRKVYQRFVEYLIPDRPFQTSSRRMGLSNEHDKALSFASHDLRDALGREMVIGYSGSNPTEFLLVIEPSVTTLWFSGLLS